MDESKENLITGLALGFVVSFVFLVVLSLQFPIEKEVIHSCYSQDKLYTEIHTDVDFTKEYNQIIVKADGLVVPSNQSMQPAIFSGNTILYENYDGEELNIGDFIIYKYGDTNILHQIMGIDGDTIYPKGMNNLQYDYPITKDLIVARVIGVLYT